MKTAGYCRFAARCVDSVPEKTLLTYWKSIFCHGLTSDMAEVLGLVSAGAGIASLAVQLGEVAIKARRLYPAMKEAPETLQHLAFEMETFSLVLHEVARQGQSYDSGDADILVRCVLMCEQSVTKIKANIDKLDSLIHRHSHLGKLRAAVEDKELSKVCVELERAKTSLGIALQLYSEYQRAKDSELIRASYKLASEQTRLLQTHVDSTLNRRTALSTSSPPYSENGAREISMVDTNEAQPRSSRSKSRTKHFHLQLKPWFVSAIWELCVCKSLSGWDVRLRTTNVVPIDAEVFYRCRDGDLEGVRKIFQDGLASPYDQSPCGSHSVLKVSRFIGLVESCSQRQP